MTTIEQYCYNSQKFNSFKGMGSLHWFFEALPIIWMKFIQLHQLNTLPIQKLSRAKSELQRETVCVCSAYKRSGQPPYNLPAAHLRFTPRSLQVRLLSYFKKWSTYE